MAKREAPVVQVEQGSLRGSWKAKESVAVFKGVPFAAPPVGDLRWRPPQPAASWTGVRDALKDGPMAIQRAADLELFMDALLDGQGWSKPRVKLVKTLIEKMPQPKQSEDCLYLSVRSPNPSPEAKLPVMVWIHGGDHQDGSGSDVYYNATALPSRGVVTVCINYRLGVMGYLAHPELVEESNEGIAGNYGTMDQIAALEWVRDNIAAFGGDCDNVTIFGESAGGESVIHMMTSPQARGLFHRAVAQSPANSGQMIHLDKKLEFLESGLDLGTQFAAALGIDGSEQLPRLRALSSDELYQVARADRHLGNHFPVVDGHILPESPFAAFAAGRQAPVPLMIGTNANEGSLLRPMLGVAMIDFRHRPVPTTGLQPEIADAFGNDMPRLLELYPGLDRQDTIAETNFMGDHMFGARAFFYARHHTAAGHRAYLYHFSRKPKSATQTAGAYHAAELPFVHGSNVPVFPMTTADKALSAQMISYWTDFARVGEPNADSSRKAFPQFSAEHPQWLRFDHTIRAEGVTKLAQYEIFNARTERLVGDMAALVSQS